MKTLKDILIVMLLGFLAFMTYVQEQDVITLKQRTFWLTGGLTYNHKRLMRVEDVSKVGLPLAATAVVTGERISFNMFKVKSERKKFAGTGVFVSKTKLVTAKHVVIGDLVQKSIRIHAGSGQVYTVKSIALDKDNDLAVVTIGGEHEHFLPIGPRPKLGDRLSCIGNPGNEGLMMTWARVANTCVLTKGGKMVFDGFTWYGCSGGPVIHKGKLVAIMTNRFNWKATLGLAEHIDRLDAGLL